MLLQLLFGISSWDLRRFKVNLEERIIETDFLIYLCNMILLEYLNQSSTKIIIRLLINIIIFWSFFCITFLSYFENIFSYKDSLILRYKCNLSKKYLRNALWKLNCLGSTRKCHLSSFVLFALLLCDSFTLEDANRTQWISFFDVYSYRAFQLLFFYYLPALW